MTLLQSLVLGIIQGLSEFLPISSSAHLVIIPYLFGWDFPDHEAFVFYVLVQDATLLGVLVYFRKDFGSILRAMVAGISQRQPFSDPNSKLGWFLLLATLPAIVIGLAFNGAVKRAFSSPLASACFLLITAGLLVFAERAGKRFRDLEALSIRDSLWIGIAQAFAIFPGISRSGSTIAAGMARDFERPVAAKISFLMSVPVMVAAGVFASYELLLVPDPWSSLLTFLPGFLAAALVGYLSIHWLLKYLTRNSLYLFSIYCAFLAALVLFLSI